MDKVLGRNQIPTDSGEFVKGTIKNIPKSGVQAVKDVGSFVANLANPNPEKNTAVNMAKLAQGAGQMLDPTKGNKIANFSNKATSYMMPWLSPMLNPKNENFEQYPKNVGTWAKDRYGSADAIKKTAYNDPVGVGLDIASVATGVGGLAKGGAMAAGKAGMSAGVASNMAKAGNTLTRAGNMVDPFMMAGKGLSKAGGGIVGKLDDFGRNYATAGLGNPGAVREATSILKNIKIDRVNPRTGRVEKVPMRLGDFITEGDLYARSVDDLVKYADELSKKFDVIADNPQLQVKTSTIISPIDEMIKKTKQGIQDFPGEASFKKQLQELQRQRKNIVAKSKDGIVPGDVVLRMRQSLDSIVSDNATRGVNLKQGEVMAKSKAISGLRSGLREANPELTTLGKKIQSIGFESKPGAVMKAFMGNESRGLVRNPITLSKSVGLGFSGGVGAMLGGVPGLIAGTLFYPTVNQLVSSPRGIRTISRGSQKAARGLGSAGRKSSPLFSKTYRLGRTGRLFNRPIETKPGQR
jgi:hypothetical protein